MVINMKYIPINKIEEILETKKLDNFLNEYKKYSKDYTLNDYITNIESYMYGYLMLDTNNDEIIYIVEKIYKYIDGVIIPLSKKNPTIFLKSKISKILIKIYNNINVEVNQHCKDYISEFPHSSIYMSFTSNKNRIKDKIVSLKSLTLLSTYIEITQDTKYLFDIYFSIKKLRNKIMSSDLKYYFMINELPKKLLCDETILIEMLSIKENINMIDLKNTTDEKITFIKTRIMNIKEENKINFLKNNELIYNNIDLLVLLVSTIKNKTGIDLSNIKNIDYESYRLLYSFFFKDELKSELQKNIQKKNIPGIKGLFIYLNIDDVLNIIGKVYINKYLLLEYISHLSNKELMKVIQDIRLINYLKKYNYIILISKLNISESEKTTLINNKHFRSKYKVNMITSFNKYLINIIEEINKKLSNKPININLIDTLCFYGKNSNYLFIKNNIYDLIEKMYSRKYINSNIDNETSIILLKEFLKTIDSLVNIKMCNNKEIKDKIVSIKYSKKTNKHTLLINKICIKKETFFDKLTLQIIVNEIKSLKHINENTNKIKLLNEIKKSLIYKKINNLYINHDNNFIKSLVFEKDIVNKYKNISDYKIDVLFKKIYTEYEIKELFSEYPILSLEYDSDGKDKNIISLIYDKYEIKLLQKKYKLSTKKMIDLKNDLIVYEYLLIKKTYLDTEEVNERKVNEIIREIKEVIDFDYKNEELNKEKKKIIKIIVNKYLVQLKNNNLDKYYNKIKETFDNKLCNIK